MLIVDVPFVRNEDNVHCFQSCLSMVLQYLVLDKRLEFEEVDSITGYIEGNATWEMKGLLYLHQNGLDVRVINDFDYQRFSNEGVHYLKERFPDNWQWQEKHSVLPQAMSDAKELADAIKTEKRIPTIEDIKRFLDEGYLCLCGVNGDVLFDEGTDKYCGHFVVIVGYEDVDCTP